MSDATPENLERVFNHYDGMDNYINLVGIVLEVNDLDGADKMMEQLIGHVQHLMKRRRIDEAELKLVSRKEPER